MACPVARFRAGGGTINAGCVEAPEGGHLVEGSPPPFVQSGGLMRQLRQRAAAEVGMADDSQ